MKIAILSPVYPYRGGIAQFSGRLYSELEKEHTVEVFSFSRLYPDFLFPGKTQFVDADDNLTQLPSERVLDSVNPFSYQQTVNAIRKFTPDVLIIAYWMPFFAPAYGHIAKRLSKTTCIVALVHNAIPHEPKPWDKLLAKCFFRYVDRFVTLSDAVKKDVLSIKPDAKIQVMPHPLYDHYGEKLSQRDAINELGLSPEKKTLLFFGLIREYKGLDLLIEAMGHLDDSYQLIIAGECYGSFDKYQRLIDKSTAKERIKLLTRYINDDEVAVLFSAADLLVLPYRSATQSGVVPIAYHFDLPVLATDAGGLKETIEIPRTGLITSADPTSITRNINHFFNITSDAFIQNIRKEKQSLSWNLFANQLINDYPINT